MLKSRLPRTRASVILMALAEPERDSIHMRAFGMTASGPIAGASGATGGDLSLQLKAARTLRGTPRRLDDSALATGIGERQRAAGRLPWALAGQRPSQARKRALDSNASPEYSVL